MKIIPTRSMQLDGRDVIEGKSTDVSDAEGLRAINSGWAVAAPERKPRKARAGGAPSDADETHGATAGDDQEPADNDPAADGTSATGSQE